MFFLNNKNLADVKEDLYAPWKREVVIASMFRGSDVKYPTTPNRYAAKVMPRPSVNSTCKASAWSVKTDPTCLLIKSSAQGHLCLNSLWGGRQP